MPCLLAIDDALGMTPEVSWRDCAARQAPKRILAQSELDGSKYPRVMRRGSDRSSSPIAVSAWSGCIHLNGALGSRVRRFWPAE